MSGRTVARLALGGDENRRASGPGTGLPRGTGVIIFLLGNFGPLAAQGLSRPGAGNCSRMPYGIPMGTWLRTGKKTQLLLLLLIPKQACSFATPCRGVCEWKMR